MFYGLIQVTHSPNPTEKDIKFILDEVQHYLTSDLDVRRADVQSAWSGIRPLVKDPNAKDTQSLVSNHFALVIRIMTRKGTFLNLLESKRYQSAL